MSASRVPFVCPLCHGPLRAERNHHACLECGRTYPVVCGIPDFRVDPDPYISIETDRQKGVGLYERGRELTFEQLVRHYYAITPEDPPDLAARWTARALQEVEIARRVMLDAVRGSPRSGGALLDIGCSTGARLIACRGAHAPLVGVDVAFRWLVIGGVRLREAGVPATLVCANAEHLPFPPGAFDAVTAFDVLEHVGDPAAAVREACRVSAPGASLVCSTNNRYAPLPEPNIHLWGVGYLPRKWQKQYVARQRRDLHPYRIHLPGPRELRGWIGGAGYEAVRVEPARLETPHVHNRTLRLAARLYNGARRLPVIRTCLVLVGPQLLATAVRSGPAAQPDATASPAWPLSTAERADT